MTDTRRDVIAAIERTPQLGASGYTCGHVDTKRQWCMNLACGKPAAWFEQDRAELLGDRSLAVIEVVMRILGTCRTTKAVSPNAPGSYEVKHAVERLLDDDQDARGYVTNGQAITAALTLGIPVRRERDGSPNAGIGLSLTDYRRLRDQG